MSAKRTTTPPRLDSGASSSPEESGGLVREILRKYHCLEVPLRFLVVVEGTTDIAYLEAAADRVKRETGFDLMMLDGGERLTVCTPITPGSQDAKRGGLPQIERLADDLKSYTIRFEIVGPICFVLDGDRDGERVKTALVKEGYSSDRATVMTLDRKSHPSACRLARKGDDPIVIEDLLSLRIQQQFFAQSRASCDVAYMDGELTRIAWRNPSKYELCAHVCEKAELADLIEVARVLQRVRALWRFEVPETVMSLFPKG